MYSHLNKNEENKHKSISSDPVQKQGENDYTDFVDNSPEAKQAAQLQAMADDSPEAKQAAQLQAMADNSPEAKEAARLQTMADKNSEAEQPIAPNKPNNTGLPDDLKTGIENLSGYSMDDVKVHYNSDKPAQLGAHAYAQGTDIYLASGQEKHLPHEAWHVVQQMQGRVKPTVTTENGVGVNDDGGLEKEADVMGGQANFKGLDIKKDQNIKPIKKSNIQRGKSLAIQRRIIVGNTNNDFFTKYLGSGDQGDVYETNNGHVAKTGIKASLEAELTFTKKARNGFIEENQHVPIIEQIGVFELKQNEVDIDIDNEILRAGQDSEAAPRELTPYCLLMEKLSPLEEVKTRQNRITDRTSEIDEIIKYEVDICIEIMKMREQIIKKGRVIHNDLAHKNVGKRDGKLVALDFGAAKDLPIDIDTLEYDQDVKDSWDKTVSRVKKLCGYKSWKDRISFPNEQTLKGLVEERASKGKEWDFVKVELIKVLNNGIDNLIEKDRTINE
ncbi:eCIS core domain-containing protein [Aureispira anguillae]|uniref:DUF4157 domain-containing protein n=1 Tax=Aureispira anguillae TaxID=2864201 RepID=A0A915YCG4_9BACT|nr:DUF4157 domain-containing protein [Aureispira anguillae]BDS10535.1 DUF4157 domain-containing protein [Aureispira anguillae]